MSAHASSRWGRLGGALLATGGLLLAPTAGAAEVYRCIDAAGRIEFRDMPCARGSGGPVEVKPNVVAPIDQTATRAASQALASRIALRDAAEQQARAAPRPSPPLGMASGSTTAGNDAGVPPWLQPGPPPERDPNVQRQGSNGGAQTPPPPASSPTLAPPVRPVTRSFSLAPPPGSASGASK